MHDEQIIYPDNQAGPGTNQPLNQDAPKPEWQFNSADTPESQPSPAPVQPESEQAVHWTASEFIAHQKTGGWYGILLLAAVAGAGLMYLLTLDWFSVVIILLMAIVMGIFAARQPRTLNYQLDSQGVYIGQKFYPYALFKSFSVVDEGAINSITLMPLKRFMPPISMYYEPKDEEAITDTLSVYLPFEHRELDQVDKLMRKIRF